MLRPSNSTLEIQPESKLNVARVIHCLIDHSETRWRINVLLARVAETGQEVLWVVEEIEELRPELQIHPLMEGQWEVLDD